GLVAVLAGLALFHGPATSASDEREPLRVHHELSVTVDAGAQTLAVADRIEVTGGRARAGDGWLFVLNEGFDVSLDPEDAANGARLETLSASNLQAPGRYRAHPVPRTSGLRLRYRGSPRFRPASTKAAAGLNAPGGELHAGGHLDPQGVYMSGAHAWYPVFEVGPEPALVTFDITAALPAGWSAVTQGALSRVTPQGLRWAQDRPQPDTYLLAGPYSVTRRTISTPTGATPAGSIQAAVYLLDADATLAARYLDAAGLYLPDYAELLGPYPYSAFALVENRRQTGFGMPGFTLLGSRVIRLPFILHTAYPHEIVHNWFGNGVYAHPADVNWSEGLTAYLADHSSAERRAKDTRFRRQSLRKYRNYTRGSGIAGARQMPLADFRGRHDDASAAVGYDKALMVFHALRRRLGDVVFFDALRSFYAEHRFEWARFDDLRRAFEKKSFESGTHEQLQTFFDQWLYRPGAPELVLRDAEVVDVSGRMNAGQGATANEGSSAHGYRVRGTLMQVQPGRPYELNVPIAIHTSGGGAAWHEVAMKERIARFELPAAGTPTHLDVDPLFDLPRRLALQELPPSLGELFGAHQVRWSQARLSQSRLPLSGAGNESSGSSKRESHYDSLSQLLGAPRKRGEGGGEGEQAGDGELGEHREPGKATEPHALWIFGFDHPEVARFLANTGHRELVKHARDIEILGRRYSVSEHCFAMAARESNGRALGWVVCEPDAGTRGEAAAAGLAKLKHYGGSSYLVTPGSNGHRAVYGDWPLSGSALGAVFDAGSPRSPLPARTPAPPRG
ncbi:MAG: M1 family metallopeptidase, partial [Gammaproteobacteria bacterium]